MTAAQIVATSIAVAVGGAVSMLLPTTQSTDVVPTAAMLALGDSVYHGKAGGALCYVCHGPAAKGVQGIGPNLTDKEWLHGDGSRSFIARVVKEGVAKPKKTAAPMPPKGGGQLNDAQVEAVAAYVHSLGAPGK